MSLFSLFILQHSFFEKLGFYSTASFCAILIRDSLHPRLLFQETLLHYSHFESKES